MELKKKGKHIKENKKSNVTSIVILLLILIFSCVLIYSLGKIIIWYINNNQIKNLKKELSNFITIDIEQETEKVEKYNIDFDNLKEVNEEAVAFLKVSGTNIEYMVVKGNDNQYYLRHTFDKNYNESGWVFADYRNKFDGTDKNIVMYAHNRRDGSLFGTLKNVLKSEWYTNEENTKIIFITENKSNIYETFSVYKIKAEDDYIKTDFFEGEYANFIEMIKTRSIYDFGIEVTSEDSILTLSTCASDNRYRVVLHAKKCNN